MGLFSKKKSSSFPSKPNFEPPIFPSSNKLDIPDFPSYEPLEQPTREDSSAIKNAALSNEDFDFQSPNSQPETFTKDHAQEIFVKIDKYRDALETIEKIKIKLRQSETIIEKLEEVREKEEKEFEA